MKKQKKRYSLIVVFIALVISMVACLGGGPALPLRSDMPLYGLESGGVYTLRGPASNPDQQKNEFSIRGINEYSPREWINTQFNQIPGVKTQGVKVGDITILGMNKIKRSFGYTGFSSVEAASYHAIDSLGVEFCGYKIRVKFNRNLGQYFTDLNDYDSVWYYDAECVDGEELDIENAELRALVLSEVWQARIASGSFFFNWGHSLTITGGLPSMVEPGWWRYGDVPNTDQDSMGIVLMMNDMVNDLKSSQDPWLEFTTGGRYDSSGTTVIYSAGDADQYANPDRLILNRQRQYAVFYRPDGETPWDFIVIRPIYDYEWNNVGRVLANIRGWGTDPFSGRLNEQGLPKNADDDVIAEMQKIGWMNAPNASLNQLQFLDSQENVLYTMTIRAFIGAKDSLIMWGSPPGNYSSIAQEVPQGEVPPVPVLYNEKGERLRADQQPYTQQEWVDFQREATIWNWLKDNPFNIGADLFVQYRFSDNTTWAPIPCSDGGTCGYKPIDWNLTSSYFYDGQIRKPWLISNLLGEVGVRTLGMSYASGRYEGTGMLFALANRELLNRYESGFSQEDIFMLDARAMQLPDHLAEAWSLLYK